MIHNKFLLELESFLDSYEKSEFPSSRWIKGKYISAYLRLTPKLIGSKRIACVVVANVSVPVIHQNKGHYSALLDRIESNNNVYIENVLEKSQCSIYEKRGYVRVDPPGQSIEHETLVDICFYKECISRNSKSVNNA